MKNKIFIGIFLIIVLMSNLSLASYHTVTMSVVEEPICSISLGENATFEKKLIQKNLTNKEVTLQLQVTNKAKIEKPTGEIMLVIDNSNSMTNVTSTGAMRKDVVLSSVKKLITGLLKDNNGLKVGAVSFSSTSEKNAEGTLTLGTAKDATLLSHLTSDLSALTNAINQITFADSTTASYTNLQAGLTMAKQLFSEEKNDKILIVLTDGLPNVILNRNEVSYNEDTISATKSEYTSIVTSGIQVMTMLTGIADGNASISSDITYNQYIEKIFGTTTNPTAGTFYYISDHEIEKTITEDIYDSLMPTKKSLKNITIVDYFPEEIVNNFDFAYVSDANIGTISTSINPANHSITWTIPELESGQTATVQYTLTLKENFDSAILDKILPTNQKVDIHYDDMHGAEQTKTSNISPKLRLTEPKAPVKKEEPKILPKAGSTFILFGFVLVATGLSFYSIIKLRHIDKKMK